MGRTRSRLCEVAPQVWAGAGIRQELLPDQNLVGITGDINDILGGILPEEPEAQQPKSGYVLQDTENHHVTLAEQTEVTRAARKAGALWTPARVKTVGRRLAGRLEAVREDLGLPPVGELSLVLTGLRRLGSKDAQGQRRTLTLLPDENDPVTKYLFRAASVAEALLGEYVPGLSSRNAYVPHVTVARIGQSVPQGDLRQVAQEVGRYMANGPFVVRLGAMLLRGEDGRTHWLDLPALTGKNR